MIAYGMQELRIPRKLGGFTMDQDHGPRSSDGAISNPNRCPSTPNLLIRSLLAIAAAFVLAIGAYSVYVAVHEPDPQETIVLGQTKLAAGSSAALRILVRNRMSGKPIKGAEVALSVRSKATTITLGTFRTDSAGSLGDSLAIPDIVP